MLVSQLPFSSDGVGTQTKIAPHGCYFCNDHNQNKLTYFLSQYNHYQDLFNNCDSCDLATKNQYKTLISAYANQFSNLYNYYSSSQLLVTLPADSRKVDLTQSDFPFLPLRPWDTVKIVTKYISGQTSTTSMYFGGIGPFSYS